MFELSDQLGFDVVPPTLLVDAELGPGSLQAFGPDCSTASKSTPWSVEHGRCWTKVGSPRTTPAGSATPGRWS